MTETVWLQRPGEDVPWGFRLSGGVDCDKPLTVQRVSPGSIASTGLQVGDAILKIGEYETAGLTQTQSQDIIKTSGNLLQILISKQGGIISNPQTPQTPQSALIQTEQPPLHQQPHPEQQQQLPPMTPETPQFANRLEEQLAGMSMNNYQPPNYSYETDNSYSSPPAPGAPGPTFKPFGATNSSTPTSPYNAPPAPPMPQPGQTAKIPARDQPQVPDAIVNMASKGSPDKKPWAYAPDMNIIQQQREKVRRRGKEPSTPEHTRGAGVIPHYQHMLNMPSFDDSPPKSKPNSTPSTPVTPGVSVTTPEGEEGEVEDVLVKHAQFNSPLNLYSENNVKDAFSYQTQGPDGPTNVKPIERQSSTSSSKDGKDLPMSPVYRMIHGLDEEKPRAPRVPSTTGITSFDAAYFPAIAHCVSGTHNENPSRISNACKPAPANIECSSPNSPTSPQRRPMSYNGVDSNTKKQNGYIYDYGVLSNGQEPVNDCQRPRVPPPLCRVKSEVFYSSNNLPVDDEKQTMSAAECFKRGMNSASVDCLSNSSTAARYGTSFRILQCLYGSEGDDEVFGEDLNVKNQNTNEYQANNYSQTLPLRRNKHMQHLFSQKRGTTEPRKEETTFEGLNRTEIPSKSFQRLQQYTDTNTIDTSSIRHNVNPDANDDGIGDYAQASIRYMGRNIPSKSFRMLQSLTGGADDTPVAPPQRRMRKPVAPPSPDTNPDEGVDIAYVGGAIPSKSFRMLQNSVGESEDLLDTQNHLRRRVPQRNDINPVHKEVTQTQPITNGAPIAAVTETELEDEIKEFNEEEYLAGRIDVLRNSTDKKMPQKKYNQLLYNEFEPWQTDDYDRTEHHDSSFDENAYLEGKVAIFGEKPQLRGTKEKGEEELPEWQAKRNSGLFDNLDNFDEDSFLSNKGSNCDTSITEQDQDDIQDNNNYKPFDENSFLKKNSQNVDSGENKINNVPLWQKRASNSIDEDQYDEAKFLQGSIQTVGICTDKKITPRQKFFKVDQPKTQRAPWERDHKDEPDARVISQPQYNGVPKPNIQRSVGNKMAGRHFTIIKRSDSMTSDSMSSFCESERTDSEADKAYNDLMYVGKKIPSKTFLKLQKSIATPFEHGPSPSEVTSLGRRSRSDDEGIDISSDTMDNKLDVGHATTEPTRHLSPLREPQHLDDVQNSQDSEVTAF